MSADIATLGLKIDTSDVAKAAAELDKLPTAGERAARAFKTVSETAKELAIGFGLGARQGWREYFDGANKSAQASKNAEKGIKDVTKAGKEQADVMNNLASNIKTLVAGYVSWRSVSATISAVIRNTSQAEQEQAQLAAVLTSTGQAAGYSQQELNGMAESLSKVSTYSAGAITSAQTRLLSYTGIVGKTFPEAMQSVIDMSARMGMSLEQSAETIGRALDIPSQGLTALTRQGFRFTEEQKKLVEALEKTGRTAEAQQIILDALKSSYGGAAAAARDTFGGSVAALQNALQDLTTGDAGSFAGAAKAIQQLTGTLQSQETKQAFATAIELIADVTRGAVGASTAIIKLTGDAVWMAKYFAGVKDQKTVIGELAMEANVLKSRLQQLRAAETGKPSFFSTFLGTPDQIRRQIAEVEAELERVKARFKSADLLNRLGITPSTAGAGRGFVNPSTGDRRSPPPPPADKPPGRNPYADADRYLENLRRQIQATQDLTVVEKLRDDMRAGTLGKLRAGQEAELLSLAQQIDSHRARLEQVAYGRQAVLDDYDSNLKPLLEDEERRRQRINDLIADTPTSKLETQRDIMKQLADELGRADANGMNLFGRFGSEEAAARYSETVNEFLGNLKEVTRETDSFAKQAAENIQSAIGSGLADILQGDFDNIGKSFTRMLNRMIAEAAAADISKWLLGDLVKGGSGGGVFGDILKGFGSIFVPSSGLSAAGGFGTGNAFGNLDLGAFFAKGGVVQSPGLSAYSGQIVDRPTVFPFAKGVGLMGEAGPEAILPLKRTANGRLGVETDAGVGGGGRGGGRGDWVVHNNFTLNAPADRRTQDQIAMQAQRGLDRARRLM